MHGGQARQDQTGRTAASLIRWQGLCLAPGAQPGSAGVACPCHARRVHVRMPLHLRAVCRLSAALLMQARLPAALQCADACSMLGPQRVPGQLARYLLNAGRACGQARASQLTASTCFCKPCAVLSFGHSSHPWARYTDATLGYAPVRQPPLPPSAEPGAARPALPAC